VTTSPAAQHLSSLGLYTKAAELSTNKVIEVYSTSFGWATKLLSKNVRQHVRNIYGLVRVADEIVDGAADEKFARQLLDELEAETYRAMKIGFSANLVVHAFAHTARLTNIEQEIVKPFFHSMRVDLTETIHNQASFDTYVYGSAEVVGLMCLRAFVQGRRYSDAENESLITGARALGSAFQKVNFLRDLSADFKTLGRSYFPNVNVNSFNEAEKERLVSDIEADLQVSAATLHLLPSDSRRAVAAAQMFFAELNRRIRNTAAEKLIETRVSVPNSVKILILTKALIGGTPK
jgi:phytoene synthase